VAERIGVSEATIWNWECHESSPRVGEIPAIIKFLCYNPLPAPKTLAENLLTHRKCLGLSQSAMAKKLGIDPATLGRLEQGNARKPSAETLSKVGPLIKNCIRQVSEGLQT
jgi:transcriptional regulator with XRE-family HTH domain